MKKAIVIVAVVVLVAWGVVTLLLTVTKSQSPEADVVFTDGELKIHVFYNRPLKKGRETFSETGLAPYGKVWRTGANEASYIEFNKPLYVKGKKLEPGKYSLWTIPGPDTWQVIFNSDYPWWPSWGIGYNGLPNRDPANDAAIVVVPAVTQDSVVEQFTISLEEVDDDIELTFWWDRTLVAVPLSPIAQ